MPEKSREQLEREIEMRDALEQERKTSDGKYALKLVEKIVFGILAAVALGIIGALISLFFTHVK